MSTSMFDEPSPAELRAREILDHEWAIKDAKRDVRDLGRLLGDAETRLLRLENSRPVPIPAPASLTMFDD